MKKRILVICMFTVVLCCQIDAQYISVHAYDTLLPSAGRTIVRSWGSDRAVSYFVTTGYQPRMEVVDKSTGITRWVDLPNEVYIKDMCVDEQANILYFCGSTNYYSYDPGIYQGYGIIGYINLSSFYTSSITISYIKLDKPNFDYIKSVNKLVKYDDGGVSQIIAIGEEIYSGNSKSSGLFYCIDCRDIITNNQPIVKAYPFTNSERYDDVLITAHHVVFVGYDGDPSIQSICYRKTYPYNINISMFSDIHVFYQGNDAFSQIHSTEMFDDTIALSYYSVNNNGDFVTRIRVIDIANDMNVNSQEFTIVDKSEPDDIVHMPVDSSLVLMQSFKTPFGFHNSNFVFVDPHAKTAYTANIEYKKNEYFQSLTTHDRQFYLAGAGAAWFLKQKPLSPTGYPDDNCPSTETCGIAVIENFHHDRISYETGPIIFRYTRISVDSVIHQSEVRTYCTNQ